MVTSLGHPHGSGQWRTAALSQDRGRQLRNSFRQGHALGVKLRDHAATNQDELLYIVFSAPCRHVIQRAVIGHLTDRVGGNGGVGRRTTSLSEVAIAIGMRMTKGDS
jgi:hypothetical protein